MKVPQEGRYWRHKYEKDGMAKVSDPYYNQRPEVSDLNKQLLKILLGG